MIVPVLVGPLAAICSSRAPVVHGSSDPPSSKGSHIQGMSLRLDRGPLPSATIHRIVYAKGLPKQLREWCSEIHYSDVLAYTKAWPPVASVPKAPVRRHAQAPPQTDEKADQLPPRHTPRRSEAEPR